MDLRWNSLFGFGALCKVFVSSMVLTLALASTAFADDMTNLIDNSPDTPIGTVFLENVTLNEGQTGNVPFRLLQVNGDGQNGCNISGSENLVVAFASTDNNVAREDPGGATLTFQDGSDGGNSACGPSPSGTPPASAPDDRTIAVKAVSRGTAEISLSQVSTTDTGTGTFSYGKARFKVTVNNVPPTITDIPVQSTNEDNPTDAIPFTVGDAGTAAGDLTMSGSSSNTTLVPNSNITFGGSGANRTVTVTPAPNKSGTATITASVSDGAATTTDTFVLTVNAVNDQPDATDDTANANEGGSNVTINVLANDTDVDGDTLTIANNTQPPAGEGSVTCSATNCTFAPNADYHGTTSFTYTISDGNGGTDTATVTVNVAATNDAPEADDDTYSVDEDGTLDISAPGVLGNDTDLDDLLGPLTTLTAAVVDGPNNGTLTLNANGSFTYTPDADYNGTDSFTYRAGDGVLNSNVATATIDVTAVNDAPGFELPASPNQTVDEDVGAQTVSGFATNVLAGPANESSQAVSFEVTDDNNALFSDQPEISSNGTLTYTPAPNASGTADVTVRAADNGDTANGGENESAVQTFTITVSAVNDVPTVTLDSSASSANEGQTKTYHFTAADIDSNGLSATNGFPDCGDGGTFVSGSLTTTSFECRFPDGPASLTVRIQISDPQGGTSNVATQAVTVDNVAPSITLSGPATAEEGDTKTYSFAVADPGEDTHTITSVCGANGTKVTGSEGYNPSTMQGGFQCRFPDGPATSNVTAGVNDSDGASDSDNQVVSITIDNVAPVAQNDGYETPEDQPLSVGAPGVLGNDQDTGVNDVLGVELAQEPGHGTAVLNPNGSFTYTPDADYNGSDSFTYTVCDDAPAPLCDGGAVNVDVRAVNDTPTAGDDNRSTDEDVALTFPANQLTANDAPGPANEQLQTLDVTDVGGAQHGTVGLDGGQITFTPAADYDGNGATFSYTVCDDGTTEGVGLDPKCEQATVNVGINPVNDAPEAHNDSYTTAEDTPLTIGVANGVLDNDIDVEGDNLTATLQTGPAHGTVVLNPNGSFTYTPDADFNGTDSFTYTVNDGANGAADGTITVTITAVNDAPVATPDTETILEDSGPVTMDVLGNDEDDDGDALGIIGFTQAGEGNVNCSGTSCTYTPDPDYNGTDSFTYRAGDGVLNSEVVTATIDVTAVNDAPGFELPAGPNQTVNEDTGAQTVAGFTTNISAGPANESSQAVSFTVTNDQHGLFTGSGQPSISPSGGLTYTPVPNASGTASVTVRATDDGGTANGGDDESAAQTFTISVNAVNDAPTVTLNGPNAVNEGQTRVYRFTVVDLEPGGFTFSNGYPDCGTGAELVGTPTQTSTGGKFKCRFLDGPSGSTVRVRVSDPQGELSNVATKNVTVANVAPKITLRGASQVKQGQTKVYRFVVADRGPDTFTFAAGYPSCGQGAVLVGPPNIGSGGSFRCKFTDAPSEPTLVLRVQDLDGGLSNMVVKTVTVVT